MKSILTLAKELRKDIGSHYRYHSKMLGKPGSHGCHDVYMELQKKSDEAVHLADYLIQHLANRHQAVTFANAVGMPGYINKR